MFHLGTISHRNDCGFRLLGDDLVGGAHEGIGGGGDGGVDSLDGLLDLLGGGLDGGVGLGLSLLGVVVTQAAAQIIIAMTAADINTFFMVASFY